MGRDDLIEKIMKIKAHADRGVYCEKSVAEHMLRRMMERNGITEADLDNSKATEYIFRYKKMTHRRLLSQIIYSVVGHVDIYKMKNDCFSVDCTHEQAVEIEMMYSVYGKAFDDDFNVFYTAFVNKNKIFPVGDSVDIPEKQMAKPVDQYKLECMMDGIDIVNVRKQLT